LFEGQRDLGWAHGKNLLVVDRVAHGRIGDLPHLASELVEVGVEVIVAYNNQAVAATKQATTRIPIVMGFVINPVGDGLIASLARPGGNITGVTWDPDPQITEKYLELLREIVPRLERVAGLIDPTYPQIGVYRRAAETAASRLGLVLRHQEVRAEADLPGAFARMRNEKIQAVFVYGSGWKFVARKHIVALADSYRLPAMYIWKEPVIDGGLISYGVSLADLNRRAAYYVDKVLRGAAPASLPVEQPTTFELVVNLNNARALGLTIPQSLLLRADQVIE